MSASDAELVRRALGDGPDCKDAWKELVDRHTTRLFRVARALGLDSTDSADVVQTAWLRLIDRGFQLRDQEQVASWLAMVVRNEARRLHRRNRHVPTDGDWSALPDPRGKSNDEDLLRHERIAALRLAYSRLSADCAVLLRLLLVEPPLSYVEVAEILERPVGAIGPTRQRCLEQLRRNLPTGLQN